MADDRMISKVAGMLAGVALGDALGMPTEFLTPEMIKEWYGEVRGLVKVAPAHPHHNLPLGSVTDDTDHTWILAEMILEDGRIGPERLAERLLEWSRTERVKRNRFVGPSTKRALEAISEGVPWEKAGSGGITVGAAMRVAPLAISFSRERLIEEVVASCAPTHYTRVAISGAMAMAFALSESLRDGATTESVAAAGQDGARRGREHGSWSWTPPIDRRIAHALSLVEGRDREGGLAVIYELIGVDYYPWELVPAAIGLAHWAKGDPMAAMLAAANLGGDTDTLASMTGSICGGLRGIEAFDGDSLLLVEEVNGLRIEEMARRLVKHAQARGKGG